MFLYKINNQFFLHEKDFSGQKLQDIVSGMMMEYRKKIVPQHKKIAPLRKKHTSEAIQKVKELEAQIPTPYNFFEQWGFTHVKIHGEAITTFEVLEREE
jgi:hypothetical protein